MPLNVQFDAQLFYFVSSQFKTLDLILDDPAGCHMMLTSLS